LGGRLDGEGGGDEPAGGGRDDRGGDEPADGGRDLRGAAGRDEAGEGGGDEPAGGGRDDHGGDEPAGGGRDHRGAAGREEAGEGEPLVLIHGVGTSRAIWGPVLPRLAATRRVIAVDLPGFGASPPLGRGFDLDAVADRVAELAGVSRFDLVGHSLGGAVAVALAARRPGAVRRLVLVAPAGLAPRPARLAAVLGAAAAPASEVRRRLGRPFADHASARWAMFATTVHDPARLHPDAARLLLDASASATRVAEGIREAVAADLRGALAAAPMPLGLVWGEADRVVAYGGLAALRRLRPDAEVVTLPRTGHVPQVERPAAFTAALERVLAALASPGVSRDFRHA
jgi:pimeloyl-ACP methyl ester carboxylesterase